MEVDMSLRPVNFSAGPAILDTEVLSAAARDVLALDGVGLSILEISHRSPAFDRIIGETEASLRRLLAVPDTHAILFLQGGARGQFAQIPLNFLGPQRGAGFVLTGNWSEYALKEAQVTSPSVAVASGADDNYTALPDLSDLEIPEDCAYVHTTSNNTIRGTQWRSMPDFGERRHVSDMSSDILSRPIDVSRFGMIYAGAQKNAGPAGVTLVIVDRGWVEEANTGIQTIWSYRSQLAKGSMLNTPPTFAIHCVGLVARWLESLGGIDAIAARNERKAGILYEALDSSDGYYRAGIPDPAHRSLMNVVWRMADETLEKRFLVEAGEAGLNNLKGHRSVGGLRASIYNAMPVEGVERLVDFLAKFRRKN
jgi:phosphoserine aminotransferase